MQAGGKAETACCFFLFPQHLAVLSVAGACPPPLGKLPWWDEVPDVQAGGRGAVPWPGWVQKRKLSLNDVVTASYLPSERVCVLVFTSPNARLSCV